MVVVLREKIQTKQAHSPQKKKIKTTYQKSNQTKNSKLHNIKCHKNKMTDTLIVLKWEEGKMAA